jgi:predicted TIM-barrel fold metal-dependent hydrolase
MNRLEGVKMPYVGKRLVYDADTHIVEPPDWLRRYADAAHRDSIPLVWEAREMQFLIAALNLPKHLSEGDSVSVMENIIQRHSEVEFRKRALGNVMLQKHLSALGAFIPEDRKLALDQMGFAAQLVFNTFTNAVLQRVETTGNLELVRAMARSHNRAIVDFCSVDHRLLPVGYVPLSDLDAYVIAAEAIEAGCRALVVASAPPPQHGPTHVALESLWATAAEARTPVVMHVGGGGVSLDPIFHETGREPVLEFLGGEGTMRSLEVLSLPNHPKQVLAALVYDGVFMRHPNLRVGVHEQGGSWVPSFSRELDSVYSAFRRTEKRLQDLSMLPSEFLLRHLRITPFPYEDIGWIVAHAGESVCMFSSDYPHHEGGRAPIERFDAWLAPHSVQVKNRFFADNFSDFIGGRLPVTA